MLQMLGASRGLVCAAALRSDNYQRRCQSLAGPRSVPASAATRNRTSATKKTILAIPTAATAIPPNPKTAAISAMISSVTTRFSIVASFHEELALARTSITIKRLTRIKVPHSEDCRVHLPLPEATTANDVEPPKGNRNPTRLFIKRTTAIGSHSIESWTCRFSPGATDMADTTYIRETAAVVDAGPWDTVSWNGISWSAVIAGALTAVAVTAIMVALGSGIGMSLASPFSSSPSGSALTIMGTVWLVFAQAIGFATGGYMTGRLRANPGRWHTGEVTFRDAANGLVVWAIGVVLSMLLLAGAVGNVTSAAGTAVTAGGAAAAAGAAAGSTQPSMLDYYTDTLLRTN